jgi:glucose-1-phosphate thymidylyltransferase
MKGIILAGGSGTRLFPATNAVCKQLLPVYDKPMIYYPLSILMLAGIREILIISTKMDIPRFKRLFGDGSHLGINISYAIQPSPDGLAQSFIIGEKFIKNDSVSLILGDNIFYGHDLRNILSLYNNLQDGGVVFGYRVKHPNRYGVVEFDENQNVIGIEEKPNNPKSNYAVCGLYFYDNDVIEIAKSLKPSKRGELEITDVNVKYLEKKKLKVKLLGRGYAWLDTGTWDDLQKANIFIQSLEERQGIKIACLEEIALKRGFISACQFEKLANSYPKNCDYGKYLLNLIKIRSEHSFKKTLKQLL